MAPEYNVKRVSIEGDVVKETERTTSGLSPVGMKVSEDVTLDKLLAEKEDISSYSSATSMMGLLPLPHMKHLSQLGSNGSGFYQQLMRDASVGALLQVNDGLCNVTDVENQFPPEECYDSGTESDDETAGYISGDSLDSANPDGSSLRKEYIAVEDYVSTFTAPISNDDLNYGRDLDYEYLDCGVDDTILDTETEVEAEVNGQNPIRDSEQGAELLEEHHVDHDMCKIEVNNDNITPSVLGDCGCAKQTISQEISPRYLEDVAAGFKKRHRTCVDGTADCRKPRDMGAIEIALRTSSNRKSDEHVFEPIMGMVFDSKEEAYEFYNMYAWEVGFSVIYNCNRKWDDGDRSMQELICQKGSDIEGLQLNQYGAAGSSAGMSDTDIMTLKAPLVHKTAGCPRVHRFQTGADTAIKKTIRKRKKTKASSKINDLNMLDEGIEPVEISPGLPYQSTFCTKCKQTGHNKKNCCAKSKRATKGNKTGNDCIESDAICNKCGLKGHNEKECLVAEDDSNSFFK